MTTEDGSQVPRRVEEPPPGNARREPIAQTEQILGDLSLERLFARAREEGLHVSSAPAEAGQEAAPEVKRIPVGVRPHSVAASPDGTRLYVTNFGDGSLSVIDPYREAVVATHLIGEAPYGVAVSPDGTDLYVASPSRGTVTQYSISGDDLFQDGSILSADDHSKNPYGTAVSPDGHVCLTLALSDTVLVTDKFLKAPTSIPDVSFPVGVVASKDNDRLYATNYFAKSVSVIDVSGKAVVATIPVAIDPYGVAMNPDGTRLYVAHFPGTGSVSVIDVSGQAVVATIPVGQGPRGVAVSPDGTRLYVTNFFADSLSVVTL
ncbi:YncE family protein [Streptomyces sp. MB09-01]|uniref:YncE family protein n=1 Tax=Streptomyces sp. MB09-01 TaxID=3028666 RepID=UPI0029A3080B|nr:YncE family protein [Streptomyces sp. MB09-01]MDX3533562.1 YncE family protein [Streptomyces sp. MB09-01]